MMSKFYLSVIVMLSFTVVGLKAQDKSEKTASHSDAELLKSANDPMANTKSFNIQNYVMNDIYGMPDAGANQLLFRYAQPVGNFLLRATLPVQTVSNAGVSPETGLGDLNLLGLYAVGKNGNKFGLGALMALPTGTNHQSSDKWQVGLAALAFLANDPTLQLGTLLQWQTDFAGKSEAKDINLLTSQIYGFWQIGGGVYLRSTGVWMFDLSNGSYNVPLGLGIGKVVKVNKTVFNIFTEPQYSVLAKGQGQARFQLFMGINMQF